MYSSKQQLWSTYNSRRHFDRRHTGAEKKFQSMFLPQGVKCLKLVNIRKQVGRIMKRQAPQKFRRGHPNPKGLDRRLYLPALGNRPSIPFSEIREKVFPSGAPTPSLN